MKLWVSKNSEVPVHDQLVAQITLGIASTDLVPGERLPSTRELARRFHVHQNTVSAAYRELAAQGLVTFKKGSGVYVSELTNSPRKKTLTGLFDQFLESAELLGYTRSQIRSVIDRALAQTQIDEIVVVESDDKLRAILVAEITAATGVAAIGIDFADLKQRDVEKRSMLVALTDERKKLEPTIGETGRCIYLDPNSVPGAMQGQDRPRDGDLIAVVSGWDQFVTYARLFLLAAKIDPEVVITRSTADRDWRKASSQASIIICDYLTAKAFGDDKRVKVFSLIADDSLESLRRSINS